MLKIDRDLLSDIQDYCRLNEINDVEQYVNKLIRNAFNIEKYGLLKKTIENKFVNIPFEDVNQIKTEKPAETNKKDDYDELYS